LSSLLLAEQVEDGMKAKLARAFSRTLGYRLAQEWWTPHGIWLGYLLPAERGVDGIAGSFPRVVPRRIEATTRGGPEFTHKPV
jgi:hypothetical protein